MVIKTQLPQFFCLDIFFKYAMYKEACQYLFYRNEFDDLFQMIKFEFKENADRCEKLRKEINRIKNNE